MIYIQTRASSPFQKIVATLAGLVILALGVMFSVVMIPVIVLIAALGLGYFYWKTRALRQAMSEQMPDTSVIEGEATVIHEEGFKHRRD